MGNQHRILVDPDPRLRAPNRAVHLPDRGLRRLVDDMIVTMRKAEGVGLAAPQIGESLRLAVIEVDGVVTVIGNPAVVKLGPPASTGRAACRSRSGSPRSVGRPRS